MGTAGYTDIEDFIRRALEALEDQPTHETRHRLVSEAKSTNPDPEFRRQLSKADEILTALLDRDTSRS